MNSKRRTPKARGRKTLRQKTSNLPIPQIPGNFKFRARYRFNATAASASTITSDMLLGVPGLVAATTTALYPIARSARIIKVECWCPNATNATPVKAELTWTGVNNTSSQSVSDISINDAFPAHLSAKPPQNSLSAFWFDQSASTNMFVLDVPSGTVVDVTLEWVENDSGTAGTAVVVTGATVGVTYYGYLDGDTTHLLSPSSRAAIF